MEKLGGIMAKFIIGIMMVAFIVLFMSLPFMWCWNYVIPYLFGLKELSWGQAWCLMFVCSCLIKSQLNNNK